MGYSTYLYEAAGLSHDSSFSLNMGQYGLGALGTIMSWWAMQYFGRRSLYLYGLVVMFVLLLVVGILGFETDSSPGASWAAGSLILVYTFVYDLTVGPVCYSLVAELTSTRLKAKSIVLARNFYNIGGIVNNVIAPRMLNPTAWNWGAKSGLFWAGICLLCIVWTYFRLPEPKGRTYGELDILFERRVPARKFASTNVEELEGVDASDLSAVAAEKKLVGADPAANPAMVASGVAGQGMQF
jgi:SP family general alpha glucoside:H+ symporter-like MFS transporter